MGEDRFISRPWLRDRAGTRPRHRTNVGLSQKTMTPLASKPRVKPMAALEKTVVESTWPPNRDVGGNCPAN